jgi:hypothetical protein
MDETRRFLRYVVPALVFLAEVALLLLVTPYRSLISDLPARLKDESAGFIALLIASTGGLGYLFSLAHHCLFWWCRWYGVDHRAFVREALDQKWLKIVLYGEWRDIRREHVTRRIAEDVIAILCYGPGRTRDAKDPALGETLVRRMDALSDLMNGLGTGFMAFIGAGAAWGSSTTVGVPSCCRLLAKSFYPTSGPLSFQLQCYLCCTFSTTGASATF